MFLATIISRFLSKIWSSWKSSGWKRKKKTIKRNTESSMTDFKLYFYEVLLVVVILRENLENSWESCFIYLFPFESVCIGAYTCKYFWRLKNTCALILEDLIAMIPSPYIRRFDQICSLFPSSMCFLAVIHSTGPDVIRTVPVSVLLCCL